MKVRDMFTCFCVYAPHVHVYAYCMYKWVCLCEDIKGNVPQGRYEMHKTWARITVGIHQSVDMVIEDALIKCHLLFNKQDTRVAATLQCDMCVASDVYMCT